MGKQNSIAIFRCVTSGYDHVLPESNACEGVDYYLFTEDRGIDVYPYKTIHISLGGLLPSIKNREIKILSHPVLSNYKVTMYVDSNIAIIGDVMELLEEFIASDNDIGFFKHPYHDSLQEEKNLCISKNKCTNQEIEKEQQYYSKLALKPAEKLSDNSILIRKCHCRKIDLAMRFWFRVVSDAEFSGRDQISLPYVRYKYNLREYWYDFSPRNCNNGYFIVFPHARKKYLHSFSKNIIYLKRIVLVLVYKAVCRVHLMLSNGGNK